MRQCLAVAPPRQRQVLAWLYLRQRAGWEIADIAAELGVRPAIIRCQRRHARRLLEPFLVGDGHAHRRWLRAGERIHQDFHHGLTGPLGPRPVIATAWALLRERGLDPGRGTRVVVLDQDELRRRRGCSVPAGSPILAELADLASRNGVLAVVLDARGTVLHRGGHRDALAAADRLGFVDGACWDLEHAGVNAAGLAQLLGAAITVDRWEHSFVDQHGLCCLAIPVRTPWSGHVTINLTAAVHSLTRVPRALHRPLHTIAMRLHRQLWAPPGPAR